MNKFISIVAAMAMASPAFANGSGVTSQSDAASQSGSYSGVNIEGSNYDYKNNTPGLGGIAGNTTAPCVISNGAGVVIPGGGIQFSTGRLDPDCVTRTEASILRDIAAMRNGPPKNAAILHFCSNDVSMRRTLIQLRLCAAPAEPSVSTRSQTRSVVRAAPVSQTAPVAGRQGRTDR